MEFLISFIISVIEWSSLKVDDSSDSFHIVDGSGKGNLSTETMSSKSSHCKLLLVHESNDIS